MTATRKKKVRLVNPNQMKDVKTRLIVQGLPCRIDGVDLCVVCGAATGTPYSHIVEVKADGQTYLSEPILALCPDHRGTREAKDAIQEWVYTMFADPAAHYARCGRDALQAWADAPEPDQEAALLCQSYADQVESHGGRERYADVVRDLRAMSRLLAVE